MSRNNRLAPGPPPQACNDEHSEVVADHCLTVGAPDALDSCPCISTPVPHPYALDGEDAGSVGVSIGGEIVAYPTGYGRGACAPHDSVLGPSCADETGAPFPDAAAWCSSNWCFVDPASCEGVGGDVTASSYFHRDGEDPVLFYSYGTCSGAASAVEFEEYDGGIWNGAADQASAVAFAWDAGSFFIGVKVRT